MKRSLLGKLNRGSRRRDSGQFPQKSDQEGEQETASNISRPDTPRSADLDRAGSVKSVCTAEAPESSPLPSRTHTTTAIANTVTMKEARSTYAAETPESPHTPFTDTAEATPVYATETPVTPYTPFAGTVETAAAHTAETAATSAATLSYAVETSTSTVRLLTNKFAETAEVSDLESYLKYIHHERLFRMPSRGSHWDRVFRAAEFFGLQLWDLGSRIGKTGAPSAAALTATQGLLLLAARGAQGLLPTFQFLHELGVLILRVSGTCALVDASSELKDELTGLYEAVNALVESITLEYRDRVADLRDNELVTIDFDATFRKPMSNIEARRDQLINRMWFCSLRQTSQRQNVDKVYRQLMPDWSYMESFYDRVAQSIDRVGHTCEWFEPHMIEFFQSEQKVLAVTGVSGTGKTVLGGWVRDRLQSPLDHEGYFVLTYTFPFDDPSRCSTLSFLRSILFQLFEGNPGDVQLFEDLASAFEQHDKKCAPQDLAACLWRALESGLRTLHGNGANVVMILDGLDEFTSGGEDLAAFWAALHKSVHESNAHIITFSEVTPPGVDETSHIALEKTWNLSADIHAYLQQSLSELLCFTEPDATVGEEVIDSLVQKSGMSFLWARFVVQLFSNKVAPKLTSQALSEATCALSGSLAEDFEELLSKRVRKDKTTQAILSFMLVAYRPLTIAELAELTSVDVAGHKFRKSGDVLAHIKSTCSDIVVVEHGALRFRNKLIRKHVHALRSKSLPSESEAHRSLTLALLLYAKLSLGPAAKSGPSFEILDGKFVDRLFSSYALLEYAARHWQAHLLASDFNAGGQLRLTDECRAVFPDSYRFVLLAWSIDRSLSQSASELIRHFEFSLEVQEACFGKGHVATLQTLIVLAKIQAATHGKGHQQFHYFYRAACVGEQDLHRFAAVVSVCAEHFLRHTETLTVAKRTEIATQRERMIRLLIKISVIRDGFSSDAVAYWYGVLFRLYITIKEYKMAIALKEEYDREVAAVGICQSGRHQIHHMYQNAGDLLINFKGEAQEMADPDYSKLFLEVGNDTQDDKNRVSLLLATALSYELQEKWTQAERIHMSLWKRIRADRAPEYTPSTKFRIAIQYAKFLRKQERIEEASDLLIGLWKEYESCTFDKEVIILIREVAVLLRSLDRPQLSISVLTKVWEWFKNEGHTDDEDAVMTSVIITEVTQEITNTTVTTTVETTEISKTLQHIFEARLEAWRNGVFDGVLFNSCLALASLYIRQKDWTCAVSVLEKTLEAAWKVILVAEIAVDAKLPERFATKCIRIAACLASCYDRQGHFDKAETIYLRAFRFCLASSDITNGNAQDCLAKLVRFYEKHWWSERAIKAYREFLDVCRSRLGRTHTLVIQTLYEVAEYAESLKRRDAYEYYVEVVEVLNEGCSHCHADALKAAVHLVKYYARYELCKRLRDICTVLWATFVHHREGVVFTEETVQLIYDEYVRVLELGNAEASVVYKISGEFLQAAKEVFGELAAIVSKARIAFADACERHEQHFIEAIQNYEELIKTATITDTTKTTIMTIKERLVTVYVKVIMSGGATTLEAGTIDRAIALCLELYYEFRADFGCWSEKTLLRLRDVIVLYQCLDAVGSLNKVVELIRAAFIDIVTTECKAASLFRAAEILASIVAMTSLADLGLELAFQARRWIVFGKVFEQGTGVTLGPGMSPSKESFVFIVSFEQRVGRAVIMTYSELMASHRRERYLLSQYQAAAGKDIKAELECGAELRAFWLELQQERLRHMLEQDLFNSFKAKYSNFIRTEDDEGMLTFFLALLASLNEERNGTDFATLVCLVANAQVRDLIAAGQFVQALKVATSAFYFANRQRFYTDQRRIAYAYKLAGLMAGIDCGKPDSSLEEEYLKLSREITTEALGILGKIEIDIVRLGFEDRNGIIRLLGRQQNYKELETLLGKLWQSVRAHKSREVKLIVSIGRLMVHARAAAKSPQEAIRFCETLHYNLCQSRGILDPVTINMSEVLASLYTNVNQFGHAARLYQQILGEIEVVLRGGRSRSHDHRNGDQHQHQHHSQQQLHSCTAAGLKLTESELVKVAGRQLELLMYARLRGGNWEGCLPRLIETYARLRAALPAGKAAPGLSVPEPRVWAAQASADDAAGQYAPPGDAEWQLDGSDRPGPGPGPRRVGSAWSINHTLVARHACGTTWEQTEEGGK